jgi:hypothetical protein
MHKLSITAAGTQVAKTLASAPAILTDMAAPINVNHAIAGRDDEK